MPTSNGGVRTVPAAGRPPSLHHTAGRSPWDLAGVLVSAAVVAGVVWAASATAVFQSERDLLAVFNHLPAWAGVVLQPAVLLGSALAIGVLAGVALFARYVRLGIAMAVAGTGAWVATRAIGALVDRPPPPDVLADTVLRGIAVGGPAPFPSSHAAVAVALAVVARPYLGTTARRGLWWLVALVAAAVLYVGLALPMSVLSGALVGWWAGAAGNALVGAPGRRVGPELVRDVLATTGLDPVRVEHVRGRVWAAAEFSVTTAAGDRLVARVLRASVRRLGHLDRWRRRLAAADIVHEAGLADAGQQVDHEALATLLAARAGVRVPRVRVARELPGGAALIASEVVEGRPLSELPEDEMTDELLVAVWQQVDALAAERVAHHGLSPDSVFVDEHGRPWITHFARARAAADDAALDEDVAELLAGLAARVGVDRAVDAALRVLGPDRLVAAAGYLQPLILPRHVRSDLDDRPELLLALRDGIAERTGAELGETGLRVRASTVLGLLVAGGAVYVVLPQVGSLQDLVAAVRGASWPWLVACFLAGMLSAPAAALSYWGSTRRDVPLGMLTAVQVASTFTGRLTPASLGGIGLNLLYLERTGLSRTEAASAATLNLAGGVVVHALLFALAALQIGVEGLRHGLVVPTGWPVMVAVGGVVVVAGAVLGSPFGRRRVVRPAIEMSRTLLETVRSPGRAAGLLGGSALVTVANAIAFVAAAWAFGVTGPSALQLTAVYVGGSAIAAAAPTPGGLGAVEAALVAALATIGIASTTAVAVVLTFRLLTFWLPILPGMATYRLLQHHEVV